MIEGLETKLITTELGITTDGDQVTEAREETTVVVLALEARTEEGPIQALGTITTEEAIEAIKMQGTTATPVVGEVEDMNLILLQTIIL